MALQIVPEFTIFFRFVLSILMMNAYQHSCYEPHFLPVAKKLYLNQFSICDTLVKRLFYWVHYIHRHLCCVIPLWWLALPIFCADG